MPTTIASAPGKVILFGEHAVVYGRPAIAAPLSHLRATAVVQDGPWDGLILRAADLGREAPFEGAAADDPFARAVQVVLAAAGRPAPAGVVISLRSAIPIAGGLGSGAAMAAAVIRALANHLGAARLAADDQVSALTYQVERLLHGTPSGIDNTVVSYERPIYFAHAEPHNRVEPLAAGAPLRLLLADTGVRSLTREVVADVRRGWLAQPERFEALFDACGRIVAAARSALEAGDRPALGQLMNDNQSLLADMGVSSPELARLAEVARSAGAFGAKLSGAGRGGHLIALVGPASEAAVRAALQAAGARALLASDMAPAGERPGFRD
ncbi:MAG: mevalonate kinase [Candidatus Promineifilaceae bacterium]